MVTGRLVQGLFLLMFVLKSVHADCAFLSRYRIQVSPDLLLLVLVVHQESVALFELNKLLLKLPPNFVHMLLLIGIETCFVPVERCLFFEEHLHEAVRNNDARTPPLLNEHQPDLQGY
jgi:hypothetical protein